MKEQFGVGLYSAYLGARKWSQSTLMMEQCAGGSFTDCVDLGERTGLRTTVIHPKGDRPAEHLEWVKEVVRQSSLLTSYPVTLYWEEEEEKDLSARLKLLGTGRKRGAVEIRK